MTDHNYQFAIFLKNLLKAWMDEDYAFFNVHIKALEFPSELVSQLQKSGINNGYRKECLK